VHKLKEDFPSAKYSTERQTCIFKGRRQDRQCTYNVKMSRLRETVVVVEKQ